MRGDCYQLTTCTCIFGMLLNKLRVCTCAPVGDTCLSNEQRALIPINKLHVILVIELIPTVLSYISAP